MPRALAAVFTCAAAVAVATACDLAIVGAGAGGAYSALRAAAAGKKVCIFERAARPGGRIHSLRGQGPNGDLIVEAGAYRFAPHPIQEDIGGMVFKVDTPLTAAVVKELGLPAVPYNPNASNWDHGLYKIVDAEGQDAGYLTFVESLLGRAVSKGAELRYRTRVVGLVAEPCCTVKLEGGEQVRAGAVILNLPQAPMLELLRQSGGAIADVFPRPLYVPVTSPIMKLYTHYDDAWWRNDLGLTSGQYFNTAPTPNISRWESNVPAMKPAPVQGSYHDGHVRCDLPGGRCRGFLQTYYGGDESLQAGAVQGAIKFYSTFADAVSNDSVTMIGRAAPYHRELLDLIHDALLELHRPALDAAGATARVASMRPTGAVLSIWSQGVAGIEGGCHIPKPLPGGQPWVPGEFTKLALKPFPEWPIYVANEAFGTANCWAEGSLEMAEMAMQQFLGPAGKESGLGGRGKWPPAGLEGLLEPESCGGRLPTDLALMPELARHFNARAAEDKESVVV